MVRSLKLELFVLRDQNQEYQIILENIMDVLFKHHDNSIIEQCMLTLFHTAAHGPEELKVKTPVTCFD